jgi:hypothetical protein
VIGLLPGMVANIFWNSVRKWSVCMKVTFCPYCQRKEFMQFIMQREIAVAGKGLGSLKRQEKYGQG